MKSIHIIVTGRVQGVGFRWATRSLANRLNVTGTVQNLESGQVELYATAHSNSLNEFMAALKKGPTPYTRVTNIQFTQIPLRHDTEFEVIV
ncbi:acylphosphatase [Levilactobacillus bambusae]|uniref:acylphosphatase n=1 Tax=Levilactobacillus bambusae TaxID=2024736 RepID=A0A2V1N1V9_9LACO|nr:acylphosphatase [Levilactobacillus bambusae]PWG01012.1 acylphosphatase [Levilactobacillus bambusae]